MLDNHTYLWDDFCHDDGLFSNVEELIIFFVVDSIPCPSNRQTVEERMGVSFLS
jgi:hypothetical protein